MGVRQVEIRNFSGGLNTRDLFSELAENEFPFSSNVTIDERGGVQKRLGYVDRFGAQIGTGLVSNLFYWAAAGKLVEQIGTGMHENGGVAFFNWTTTDRCGMCEFLGNLVMIHPVDGMKVWNGTVISTPTNAPVGNTCYPWQNKVWSGGDPANPPRLYYSDLGSVNRTSANQYNDLREKDSSLITCLAGSSGIDVSGRPGLMVYKQDSAYRVYDASNGAYNTIDASMGCASNIGAVSAFGRTYTITTRGIYSTDGLDPLREESVLVENLFHKDQINQSRGDLYAAGRFADRLRFSIPKAAQTANSIALEIHPTQRWIVPHTDAGSCYASIVRDTNELVMGSPSSAGRIYNTYKGGNDNGAAIVSKFQTGWRELADGNKARIRRARYTGLGEFSATVLKDYEAAGSLAAHDVALLSSAAIYDDAGALYDNPNTLYGPVAYETKQDFWSVGVLRQAAILIEETSSLVGEGPPILDGTAVVQTGAWRLSNIKLMTIDLGVH